MIHKKIAVVSVTDSSELTARRLAAALGADTFRPEKGGLRALVENIFHSYDGLVFIMASGIVIRMIAPLISDKYHDPAVITVDDACRYAISTLSGHEGGANDLCWKVASFLGAEAVITTASDTNRSIVLGIGCRKDISEEAVRISIEGVLEEQSLTIEDIRCAVSAELKKNEEGLLRAMEILGIPLIFQPLEKIRGSCFEDVTPSDAAMRHFNIPGVSEPCALLTAKNGRLIMKKKKIRGVTIALAKEIYE